MEKPNNMTTEELANKITAELFINGIAAKEELKEVHESVLSTLRKHGEA